MKNELEILHQLENKFHARYVSVSQLKGQGNSVKWLKRSWLDVKKEIRKLEAEPSIYVKEMQAQQMISEGCKRLDEKGGQHAH